MEKKYLFSPGPTMLPPEVLLKMAEPIMHHREPEFEKIVAEIREGLKYLFQTKNEVLVFFVFRDWCNGRGGLQPPFQGGQGRGGAGRKIWREVGRHL